MNSVKNLFIFASGLTIGSLVTWKLIKTKYEQYAQEEIDSVKEVYAKRHNDTNEDDRPETESFDENARAKADEAKEKPSIVEYASKLHGYGYTNYSELSSQKEEDDERMYEPCVIPPEEFGACEDYDQLSLTYFSDGVLADENDEPIDNVDELVGLDSLNHFGEFEDDSVFVRNDRLKADIEILLDLRNYSDVVKTRPHSMEE